MLVIRGLGTGGLGLGVDLCALAFALLGALAGFLEAIGFALDGDDLGVVDQPIDQGDDSGGVGKDLVPLAERSVGGDEDGFFLVATADDLEQQVGVAIGVGEVADLIDDQ